MPDPLKRRLAAGQHYTQAFQREIVESAGNGALRRTGSLRASDARI